MYLCLCKFPYWRTSIKFCLYFYVLSLIVLPAVLCVAVMQGQSDWGVTYPSTPICALKRSTVDIPCTYRYPSTTSHQTTGVRERLWFTKFSNNEPVDLKTDSDYTGRVQYNCDKLSCTLRITDLRESDSAEYKFRFITNHTLGGFTGSPGVTLSVTGNILLEYLFPIVFL